MPPTVGIRPVRSLLLALGTLLILSLTGCGETSGSDSSFGDQVKYENAREPIDARVETEGINFTTRLEISGHRGERMEVRIYGDNGKLLGFKYVTPQYDDSVWEKFSIFVPRDRLAGMRASAGIDLYVIAGSDPTHFVGHDRFNKSNLDSPPVVWDWVEYQDGATLTAGARGLKVTVALNIDGHKGETLETWLVVTDLQMNEIGADRGGPIRVAGPTIAPTFDNCVYKSLTFEIPYERLRQVPPNVRVKLTPCVKLGDQIVLGNLHFTTWAGGTADDVRQKVRAAVADYHQEAERLQNQINALQAEGGK